MTRVVGPSIRSEFILDPAEALARGRVLDAMLARVLPPHPRGVFRGSHRYFNELDDARRLEIARRLNRPGWGEPR
ncbi:MAG: hypothetical protein HY854_25110 [Burkholderiales bacterium]|nr:hypothetical protein [Burkholderiales bacterium]